MDPKQSMLNFLSGGSSSKSSSLADLDSYSLRINATIYIYRSGGYGIGLKDVITTAFSIMGYNELNITTYHLDNDYRTFRMRNNMELKEADMIYP